MTVVEKPAGYQEHHRQKRRGGDERPVNKLYVSLELHDWIEKHPEEARALGWTVPQNVDPADVVVVIPDSTPAAKPEKEKKPRAKVAPKERKVTAIRTPKEEENIIPELIELNIERHAEAMGWQDDVPSYFVIVLALAKLLELAPGDVQADDGS